MKTTHVRSPGTRPKSVSNSDAGDLCSYVIWMSIEFNIVIICASIPLLRPLFQASPPTLHARTAPIERRSAVSTVGSLSSKGGNRSSLVRINSEDNMIERPADLYSLETLGIHVTTEVSVTFQSNDLPHVHAALVGLIQGEIINPRLVQR